MIKLLTLLVLSANPSPLGGSNTSRGNLERIPDYNTVQNTAWFVDPAGADTGNSCLSAASPCQSIQRVVTLISAKHLRHQQVIYAAAGNYACVELSGFQTDNNFSLGAGGPISSASGAGIAIVGTMANSTLTGADGGVGVATGTITSSVTGSTTLGVTFTTFTDSTQHWGTSNLKGRFVTFGNFTRQLIYDNTATTATLILTTAAPTAGTTYAIQDAASFFNSASCSIGSSVGVTLDGGFNGAIATQGAFIVSDTTPGAGLTQYRLQQFAFSNTTGLDVNNVSMARVDLTDVQLQNTTDTVFQRVAVGGVAARFNCQRCAFRRSAANNVDHMTMSNVQAGFLLVLNSLFEGGKSAVYGGEGQLLFGPAVIENPVTYGIQARGPTTDITSTLCKSSTNAITTCFRFGETADLTTFAKGQMRVRSSTCQLGGGFAGTCVDVQGAGIASVTTSVFTSDAGEVSDPSTPLFRLYKGAGIEADTTSTFTAITPNDIQLLQSSGGSGTTITFQSTGVRASVPPCITDSLSNWWCSPQ
jgi:hypothetical protein